MMKTSSLRRQSGLNLIEILIAALILSVGLLSMAGLQVASLKSTQNATQKQQASAMVHELLERMRSNRAAALANDYAAEVACSSPTPPFDCTGSTACSPAQLAAFDLYNVQCQINNQLLGGALTVSCPSGSCPDGIRVSMDWNERLASEEVQEDVDGTPTNVETQAFNIEVNAVI